MDKLIEETERKFLSKFSSPNGDNEIDVELYVEKENQAFSLNSLVEMDNHLISDTHFQEMVQDVERYCSEQFVQNLKPIDRYYVYVGGLLRGLLRECVSFYDPYERKKMIEQVYGWYRDKRKVLLDYRLRKNKREQQLIKQRAEELEKAAEEERKTVDEVVEESTSDHEMEETRLSDDELSGKSYDNSKKSQRKKPTLDELRQKVKEKLEKTNSVLPDPHNYQQRKASHFDPRVKQFDVLSGAANDPAIPFYLSEEKKRKVFIHNKLKQYSRRNIAKTDEVRKTAASNLLKSFTSNSPIHTPVELQPPQYDTFRKYRSNQPDRRKKLSDLYAFVDRTDEEKDAHIMKQWLSHRATEAEEQLEEMEFKDAVVSWSSNRARMEEEIHRRHESLMVSAQTGLRVQRIVRKLDLEVEKEKRKIQASQNRKLKANFLDSSSEDEDEGENDRHYEPIVKQPPPVVEKREEENTAPVFLSPYNNTEEIGMPLHEESPVPSELNYFAQDQESLDKGFLTPNTHRNIPPSSRQRFFLSETSKSMGDLKSTSDSISPAKRVTKKPGDFSATIRPSSTNMVHRYDKKQRNSTKATVQSSTTKPAATRRDKEDTPLPSPPPMVYNVTKPSFGKYLPADKVVAHNVYEHYVAQVTKHNETVAKSMKANKKPVAAPTARPSASRMDNRAVSPSSSRPPSSRQRNPTRNPAPVSEQRSDLQLQSMDDLGQPPSLLFSSQMDECERIKLALAQKRINVPSSVIERSIVIPEDQPYQKCIQSLPGPSFYMIDDISLAAKKKRPRSSRHRVPGSASSSRPASSRPSTGRPVSSGASRPTSSTSTVRNR